MELSPETVKLVEFVGPIALTIAGALLTAVSSVLGFAARMAWKIHQRRMGLLADAIAELAKGMQSDKAANHADHRRVWEAINALKAELVELSGTSKRQQGMITQVIKDLATFSGELKTVIRFAYRQSEN